MTRDRDTKDPNVDTFDHKGADDAAAAGAGARRVKVPAVPGPRAVLCYMTPPLDGSKGNPMLHCDRKASHGGRHSWEHGGELPPIDAAHVRTLVFRLNRASETPEDVHPDERRAVLREARQVLEQIAAALEVQP